MRFEKILFWIVRVCAYILPFTVLFVADSLFFPFITGKNFMFRILVEIMAAGWIGLLILDFKKYWPKWSFVSIAFAVFVSTIFVSAVFGVDFKHSFWSNFERMEGLITHLHLLALFFVLAGTFRTQREWLTIFGVSVGASVLVALYGLLEYSGEVVSVADSSRIISTLGNPLYVAAYLSFHIFLSAFLWLQTKSTFLKWLLGGIILFELPILFLTASRGAFVGMLGGIVIIFFLSLFSDGSLKKKITISTVIIALLFTPVLLNISKDTSFVKGSNILIRLSNINLQAGEARFTIWGMAIESFKERPVLGWGIGNFSIPYAKHYDPKMFGQEAWFDRTHNMPLEWLVSGGLVGFLAYLTLLFSILWALVKAVKHEILQKRHAFIFVGMFSAYLVQLLFVFDTLPTYLMLAIMLGFFYASSSATPEVWSRKNTLALLATAITPEDDSEQLSRKKRVAEEKKFNKANRYSSISILRLSGIAGAFVVASLLITVVNIRPMMANATYMQSLRIPPSEEAKGYIEKALLLSKGTIGTPEFREHLAINTHKITSQPELLQKPEVNAFYRFAVEEMEKEIQDDTGNNLKIKHNILLAQLYGMLAVLGNSDEALALSMTQYDKSIQFAPNYVNTYPVMANTLAQTGRINEAIPLIEKAEELLIGADRYDSKIFYSKPLFYAAVERYDDAYNALKILRERNEGLDLNMIDKIVLTTRSQGVVAIPFLEKVYKLDKRLNPVSLMLAQLNAAAGNYEQAKFYASEALKQDPSIKGQVDEFLNMMNESTSSPSSVEGE